MSMVCDSLQIWVLIQDIVIDVQEELERVLVQEMYLKHKEFGFLSRILLVLSVNGLCLQNCNTAAEQNQISFEW